MIKDLTDYYYPKIIKALSYLEYKYDKVKRLPTQLKMLSPDELERWDSMGVRSDDQIGRTYGRVGKTPVVETPGRRFSCQMISTVTNRGTLRFMIFDGKFNADVLIQFLKRLVKTVKRKIGLRSIGTRSSLPNFLNVYQAITRLLCPTKPFVGARDLTL